MISIYFLENWVRWLGFCELVQYPNGLCKSGKYWDMGNVSRLDIWDSWTSKNCHHGPILFWILPDSSGIYPSVGEIIQHKFSEKWSPLAKMWRKKVLMKCPEFTTSFISILRTSGHWKQWALDQQRKISYSVTGEKIFTYHFSLQKESEK